MILAIPFRFLVSTLEELHGLEGKVVITPVNPIQRTEFFSFAPPPEGSAAMLVKKVPPPDAKVCTAFNNIAANRWQALDEPMEYSVAVCGDDEGAKGMVMALAASVPHLEPLMWNPLQRHQWSRA